MKSVFFTHEDLEATIDFFQYGMRCLVDESDNVMVLLPGIAQASIGIYSKKHFHAQTSSVLCMVF